MNIIYLLILVSLVLITVIAIVFYWAVHSGQFDDLDKSSNSVLMDEDDTRE